MPLLNESVRAESRRVLAALRGTVRMSCFTQASCPSCQQLADLTGEVAALSPALLLEVKDLSADREEAARLGVSRVPALALSRHGETHAPICYFGLPAGHEFGAFLRALVLLSTGGGGATGVEAAAVASITRPASLKVFVLAA